jgi:hypothetical protein
VPSITHPRRHGGMHTKNDVLGYIQRKQRIYVRHITASTSKKDTKNIDKKFPTRKSSISHQAKRRKEENT